MSSSSLSLVKDLIVKLVFASVKRSQAPGAVRAGRSTYLVGIILLFHMKSVFWQAVKDWVEVSGSFPAGDGWRPPQPAITPIPKMRGIKEIKIRMKDLQRNDSGVRSPAESMS